MELNNSLLQSVMYRNVLYVVAATVLLFTAAAGIFFATLERNPFTAELAYIEYSEDSNIVGSVVPASCESNPINSHYISGDMCQCAISASPSCSGDGCSRTISWSTNFRTFFFGGPNLRVNGDTIAQVSVTGSMQREIPPGGQTFSLHRPDGVQLCAAFVPGPQLPSLTFTGVPTMVNFGGTVNLTWTVANATSCTASGDWSGTKAASGTNNEVVTPAGPATYTLTCSGQGGTVHRNVAIGVNPPTLTLAASPDSIGPDSSSTLTWNVAGATSCTAMGGWSGTKEAADGTHSEVVSPTTVTTYTLSCTGPGGTALRAAVVLVPTGSINTTSCVIPDDGANCPVTVNWSSANFVGSPRVTQGATVFSTQSSSAGQSRLVNPDNDQFTLYDTNSSFVRTASAFARCSNLSTWTGTVCRRVPVIEVVPDPVDVPTGTVAQANINVTADSIVRRGETADVEVQVNSTYDVRCTLTGAVEDSFVYTVGAGTVTYSFVSRPLQSATIINISCASIEFPEVVSEADVIIQVTAAQFES